MAPCRVFADWLALAETAAVPPQDVAAHARECPDCRRARRAWADGLEVLARATEVPIGEVPDLDRMRSLARLRPVPRRSGRAVFLAAPLAAAAVAILAWMAWPAGTPTDPPAGTGSQAATEETQAAVRPTLPLRTPPAGDEETLPSSPVAAGQILEAKSVGVSVSDDRVGTVTLDPGTRSRVMEWTDRDVRLFLEVGRLQAEVIKRPPGGTFEVHTDLAIVRVVGTRFIVDHRPGVATVVTGLSGRVAVSSADGIEIARLAAGQVVRVGPGVAAARTDTIDTAFSGVVATLPRTPPPVPPPGTGDAKRSPKGARPQPSPLPLETVLARARELMRCGSDTQAAALLTRTLEGRTEGRPRLLAVLGDAWRLAGRPSEAREAYESAVASGPREAPEGVLPDLAALHEASGAVDDAARAWRSYLVAWPDGAYAGRALWALAGLSDRSGHPEEAIALWKRLLIEAPRSPEAPAAFAKVGRALADEGRLPEADSWFATRDGDLDPAFDEASLVGRMRTRLLQGDTDAVKALLQTYRKRHPAGARREEADRFLEAAGASSFPANPPP